VSRRLHLLRLLEGYTPGPGEQTHYAKMLVLAGDSADVFSRYHFSPGHFTVSGFVVSGDRTRLLLVHHERLDKWLQPGGHIEPGDEDLPTAARREIEEETGLGDLRALGPGVFDIDVHAIPAARGEPRHEHHDVRFLFTADGVPEAGAGTKGAAWVPLDEVRGVGTDRSVLRAVAKLSG
jgi:8-oxo-dGTP pyrophosphatase MutT (NUDIX family)